MCRVGSAGGYKVGPGNFLCLQQVMSPAVQKLLALSQSVAQRGCVAAERHSRLIDDCWALFCLGSISNDDLVLPVDRWLAKTLNS